VAIIPGHTQFTRIPEGPSSLAMARVNVMIAPFESAQPFPQCLDLVYQFQRESNAGEIDIKIVL
jgi:hypothetical protein